MAGQQSFTPPPVTPSRSRKYFTLDQANSALPLVKRIVADIVNAHRQITDLRSAADDLPSSQARAIEERLEAVLDRLHNLVDELSAVGCDLKDFEIGLIDFTAQYQGREIFLCWKLGEDKINFWHELYGGFAGRQPVALLHPE